MFREALCQQLNSWDNYRVILQAGNGKELIEGLDSLQLPAIVLTDLCMPVMNGYETIYEIKRLYPSIKILVISMYGSEETARRVIKSGAHGFVNKMDDMGMIRTAMQEIMENRYFFNHKAASGIMKQALRNSALTFQNDLSEEELKFLKYICTEKTYKAIAAEMGITGRQVEYLRYNLFERFEVQSRTGLAVMVIEKGLVV